MIADNINGTQRSNNFELNVKRLYLDTNTEKFEISDIKIKPLSTNTKKDYLFGDVKSISVDGLEYTLQEFLLSFLILNRLILNIATTEK